ncbi:MAG: phosphopantetheine-binding protein, partial [Myxococcota bacterium]
LREVLSSRLPAFMVPSAVVVLERFPLTGNGKLDRRALPEPDGGEMGGHSQHVAPRTTTEKRLAELFTRALDIETIGIHDDFFAMGGHSLLATQLVSGIHKEFRVEIPLRTFFENQTIAALGQLIDAVDWGRSEQSDIEDNGDVEEGEL